MSYHVSWCLKIEKKSFTLALKAFEGTLKGLSGLPGHYPCMFVPFTIEFVCRRCGDSNTG